MLSLASLSTFEPPAWADPVTFVNRASTWKFLPGLAEASTPDPSAWRRPGFDDASWMSGALPIGFGDAGIATNLSLLAPPMQNNYTSVFLRRDFQVADPTLVINLQANVNYDDGFIIWINGQEVLRINVAGTSGDPVAFNDVAFGNHEATGYEDHTLPPPGSFLVSGTNTLAVHAFNVSLTSSDFNFDLELVDLFGPDQTPPAASTVAPLPGAQIRALTQIEVTFSEEVAGVDAGDLLIGSQPAAALSGSGPGPYVFSFSQPQPGAVPVAWKSEHGISDFAAQPNAFLPGGGWSYTLDPSAALGDVVINEFAAANLGGLKDEEGDAEDWIEIFNRGAAPVSLAGWSLTDDLDEPGKWTFPVLALGPQQYLVIFASGKDRKPTGGGNLHTNFKLNADGEYLGLYTAEVPRVAVQEFKPQFPQQRGGYTFGLEGSGKFHYLDTPTPRAANASSVELKGFVADPTCSARRGFYNGPFTAELSTITPEAAIYYTLDGSEPAPANGTLYSIPVSIAGMPDKAGVTLRTAAFKDGYLPSNAITHTFIFAEQVLAQPLRPAGFPASWGNTQTTSADYEVDPQVVNDPAYAGMTLEGLQAIPAVSVVMDMNDLFGRQRGIYSNPSLEGIAWERPASAELIYSDGRPGFQIDCGIRIQGGSSTANWKSLKLSMRLVFKDDYGRDKLEYPLYPGSTVDHFDTLVLDAGLNLTWNHPDHGQRVRSQYVRDQFVSDLQNAEGSLAPHGVFVHLYLNGLYWGLFDLHERADEDFAAAYLGGDPSEYDVFKHTGSQVINGNAQAWNAMMAIARKGLASNNLYEDLQEVLDVDDLIDYMLINLYSGNDDWPRHNWYAARRRVPGARFRFFSWDAEHVLKDVNINQTSVSESNSPAELYSRLRQNAEFRLRFADRVHRHFFNNGVYFADKNSPAWDPSHPERNVPAALYNRRIAEIDPAIVCESARWGDVRRSATPYTRNLEWMAELKWLNNQYFPKRTGNVLNQFKTAQLYPGVEAPIFNQHGGTIQPGFFLTMELPAGAAGTIYYTLDGSDPRAYGTGEVAGAAVAYAGPVVLNDYTQVRARTLDGAAWSALNEATFNLESPYDPLRVSEIHYNPLGGREYEFLELENAGSRTIDLSGLYFDSGLTYTFPPNTALGPGAFLVLAANAQAFASRYRGAALFDVYSGSLDNGGEKLSIKDKSGIVILSFSYDDEGLWPVAPDGFGYSLVLIDPARELDDPENWRASAHLHGSPGTADPAPASGGVVINEVLANSPPPLEDAIELHNLTGESVSIGGWYLSDSRADANSLKKFRIPDGAVLPPGGFAVFYENQFNSSPGSLGSFSLAEAGGAAYLSAADGAGSLTGYITGVEFGASHAGISFGRKSISTGTRFTALRERTFGIDQPATVEEFRGGAGKANADALVGPAVLNEIHYHPLEGELEFLELFNLAAVPVALHEAASGRGWRLSGLLNLEGTDDFEFGPGTSIPGGGFLLLIAGDPDAFRAAHGIPPGVPIAGPFGGALDNAGERLKLLQPELAAGGEPVYIVIDGVRYNDKAPWPAEADGTGPSLERASASEYADDPDNWAASLASGGSPGEINTISNPNFNRPPVPSFTASPASGKVPLVVSFDASATFDPDGEVSLYDWNFGDGTSGMGKTASHTFNAAGRFAVTLKVTDNKGAQRSSSLTIQVEPIGGGQIPGDCNQDGALNIADAVCLLIRLFVGSPNALPCDGGALSDPGNVALLDVNGDSAADVSDVISELTYLFLGGAPPKLGTRCLRIPGCPNACAAGN
ncbi:MAG: lamin tail domain-containing protein [Planctomycetes bacterium]|nr:lamin tail domain-containing protein [Planctomycetota bacterium]